MRFRKNPAYTFDDVLLVPHHSKIASRADVDLSTMLGKMQLRLPILSANMDTVTETAMAEAMCARGGAGVLHRFASLETQEEWIHQLNCIHNPSVPKILSVGLDVKLSWLYNLHATYNLSAVCIDVAHGDHVRVIELLQQIRKRFPDLDIIAGNVATGEAAIRLVEAGANIIKAGVGPGSVCSTRIMTGHGVPQLSAILDVSEALDVSGTRAHIIADGGIRNSGDIVKALAAGADAVMLGSLLAGTEESPGDIVMQDGQAFKAYRGMASYDVQKEKRAGQSPRVEGVSAKIPFRGGVDHTLNVLENGIRSGLSYSGVRDLAELRDFAEFVVVTQNGVRESGTHHPWRLSST